MDVGKDYVGGSKKENTLCVWVEGRGEKDTRCGT